MLRTISIACDFSHLRYPYSARHESAPNLQRRVSGIALLLLSIPFTLGIMTGFYLYWAHKKVVRIKKEQTAIDAIVQKLFGTRVGNKGKCVQTARSLFKGNSAEAFKQMKELKRENELTDEAKLALIALAIEKNEIDFIDSILDEFNEIELIPLHKAQTGDMVKKLIDRGVPVDIDDDEGNTTLHLAANLEVAKALKEAGAGVFLNKKTLSPLHTCKDPEVAKYLISQEGFGLEINKHHYLVPHPIYTVPLEVQKEFIKGGANLKIKYPETGQTLLHTCEDYELAKLLLQNGADLDSEDSSGNSPLFTVQNPKVLQLLIEKGANVRAINQEGRTLLHCRNLPKSLLDLILEKGNVEGKTPILEKNDLQGNTPILANPSDEMRMLLINKGANVRAQNRYDQTLLHRCKTIALAKRLIELKLDVNAKDIDGNTPLHRAKNRGVAAFLLDHKASLNALNDEGKPPLLLVKNPQVLKLLINRNADLTIRDSKNRGLLHYAAKRGKPELVELLLNKKQNPNEVDVNGNTPLMLLLEQGSLNEPEALKLLMTETNINISNVYGRTALHYLIQMEQNHQFLQLFLDKGANPTVIDEQENTLLFYCKDFVTAKRLVDLGVDPKKVNEEGQNALFFAFSDTLADYLVNTCKVDIHIRDLKGQTPLHTCSNVDAINWFLEGGKLDPNQVDTQEQTPLHVQVESSRFPIVNALIAKGANVNAKANLGLTPLHLCSQYEMAKYLIWKGASCSAKDDLNQIPLILKRYPYLHVGL